MGDVLGYRPTPNEKMILDKNNIRWNDFCRANIQNLEKDNKDTLFDKVILRMIIIALGCLIFAFSPLLNDIVLVMLEYLIGTTMVFIGVISLIMMRVRRRADARVS